LAGLHGIALSGGPDNSLAQCLAEAGVASIMAQKLSPLTRLSIDLVAVLVVALIAHFRKAENCPDPSTAEAPRSDASGSD